MKNFHRVIKFNQNACQKPFIDAKTDLRKKILINAKNGFDKDFLKLMNNVVFGKNFEKCQEA